MTATNIISGRSFLISSIMMAGGLCVAGCGRFTGLDYIVLTADEAKTLDALADQIIPKDDYPGGSEAGAIKTWKTLPGSGWGVAQHQAGSCRMGDDPQTSVTNSYGQVHGIDNLFIADGSLHLTNGAFNPALTIMALAYRVGGHIVERFSDRT